jgi:mannose-6-phosphate isomerase-like protein (cupin superfamily)
MKAISLNAHRAGRLHKVEKGSDELIIIKEGVAEIKVNKESYVLGEGSVVVASSGDKLSVSNTQNTDAVYYSVSFKPYSSGSAKQTGNKISPLFVDWNKVEFRPSVNGGMRSIIRRKTSSLNELEIHVTTIKEGITARSIASHPEEGFVLIRKGIADVILDGNHYKGGPGSLFFLASNCPHSISNIGSGDCEYYAAKWFTDLPALK